MILTFLNEEYECTRAVKGTDWIKLYDNVGECIVTFSKITDFSGYVLNGTFETPPPTQEEINTANIDYLSMMTGVEI